jgi:DNA-binding NtrC family response regulator
MKSIKLSRIVAVADSDHGRDLVAHLRRMEVAKVIAVTGLGEAWRLCQSGGADACLVTVDGALPDGPAAKSDAPGRSCGIPALIIAPVVTPHLRRTARRCGYLAAVSATIPPRMLYRRIGAALQHRRAAAGRPQRLPGRMPFVGPANPAAFGKPTLH